MKVTELLIKLRIAKISLFMVDILLLVVSSKSLGIIDHVEPETGIRKA